MKIKSRVYAPRLVGGKFLALMLSLTILTACGGSGGGGVSTLEVGSQGEEAQSEDALSLDTIEFTLVNVDDEGAITDQPLATGNILTFGFIPGHLFGFTLPDILIQEQVDSGNKAEITFDRSIFTESAMPEILSVMAANDGLIIEPNNTEFGRLSTAVFDASGQRLPGAHGLSDGDQLFFITYFDRAAFLNGEQVDINGDLLVYNIDIPDEGFYAIKLDERQENDGSPVFEFSVLGALSEALYTIR